MTFHGKICYIKESSRKDKVVESRAQHVTELS